MLKANCEKCGKANNAVEHDLDRPWLGPYHDYEPPKVWFPDNQISPGLHPLAHLGVQEEPPQEHVCKPSCHNPCLLDDYNPWKAAPKPPKSRDHDFAKREGVASKPGEPSMSAEEFWRKDPQFRAPNSPPYTEEETRIALDRGQIHPFEFAEAYSQHVISELEGK